MLNLSERSSALITVREYFIEAKSEHAIWEKCLDEYFEIDRYNNAQNLAIQGNN